MLIPLKKRLLKSTKQTGIGNMTKKMNRTNALATTMDMLVPTFIRKDYRVALQAFDQLVEKTREIIRPGRSNPRKKNQRSLTL